MPWSPRAWGEAVYLAAGIPVQIVAGAIFAGMIVWSIAIRGPKTPAYLVFIWLAGIALILLLTPVLTRCTGTGCGPRPASRSRRSGNGGT